MVLSKLRHLLTAGVFIAIIGTIFILRFTLKQPDMIVSEKRKPAELADITWDNIINGNVTNGFEDYAADSFPLRESFRTIHAFSVLDVFRQADKGGLYYGASGAGKFEKINARQWEIMCGIVNNITESVYHDSRVFFAAIPDKSIYSGRFYPGYDPDEAAAVLQMNLKNAENIDITDALTASSFYKTDHHWDQPELAPLLAKLGTRITGSPWVMENPEISEVGEFEGIYSGQLALPISPDIIRVVSVPDVSASYMDARFISQPGPVYDSEGYLSAEPYNVFLCGVRPVVKLTNAANAGSGRHLVVYRDSFGASLGPLIAQYGGYETVTLIDLRQVSYKAIQLGIIPDMPENPDVLFIMSAMIMNDAANWGG